jgi:ABC transporter substrate binding protein
VTHRAHIAELEAKYRLSSMHGLRPNLEAGGLVSYGPNIVDEWQRAASFVDKILNGARPADLPVEQPTKYEFLVNLKTTKALGLAMPQSLLLRADILSDRPCNPNTQPPRTARRHASVMEGMGHTVQTLLLILAHMVIALSPRQDGRS